MAMSKPGMMISKLFGKWSGKTGTNAVTDVGQVANRWLSLDPDQVPLLNRINPAQRQKVLVITLLVSLLLAAVLIFWNTIQVGNRAE